MTVKTHPTHKFVRIGETKLEVTETLLKDFTDACKYLQVKRIEVFRYFMQEFVEEVRNGNLDFALPKKSEVLVGENN